MSDDYRLFAKVGDEYLPLMPAGTLFSIADNELVSDHVWVIESGKPQLYVDRRAVTVDEFKDICGRMLST